MTLKKGMKEAEEARLFRETVDVFGKCANEHFYKLPWENEDEEPIDCTECKAEGECIKFWDAYVVVGPSLINGKENYMSKVREKLGYLKKVKRGLAKLEPPHEAEST